MTVELVTVPGAALPLLGWHHRAEFDPAQIGPIQQDPFKPHGGLWTSPLRDEDGGTAWSAWCTSEAFHLEDFQRPTVVLRADPDARVYVIDSHADLVHLGIAYPAPILGSISPGVDWVTAAEDLDAIWLTEEGQWATRHTSPSLYGWDCETVLWLRPALTVVGVAAAA